VSETLVDATEIEEWAAGLVAGEIAEIISAVADNDTIELIVRTADRLDEAWSVPPVDATRMRPARNVILISSR
jgi:hypothetical protein